MMTIENPEETWLRIVLDRFEHAIGEFTFVCRTLKDYNCCIRIQGDDVIISCGNRYINIGDAMDYVKDFARLVRGYTDV